VGGASPLERTFLQSSEKSSVSCFAFDPRKRSANTKLGEHLLFESTALECSMGHSLQRDLRGGGVLSFEKAPNVTKMTRKRVLMEKIGGWKDEWKSLP
jgi:hypothetical protein